MRPLRIHVFQVRRGGGLRDLRSAESVRQPRSIPAREILTGGEGDARGAPADHLEGDANYIGNDNRIPELSKLADGSTGQC
jgi:hypothetical protein